MSLVPRDDRESNSAAARMKRKEVLSDEMEIALIGGHEIMVLCDDDKDEDLNDALDKMCKAIMNYVSPNSEAKAAFHFVSMDYIPRLGTPGFSRFVAFSKRYKSKFDAFMASYSRVGMYSKKDVLPAYVSGRTCPTARCNAGYVLERYKNFKRFDTVVDHSDHLFSNFRMHQTTEAWAEHIRKEQRILEEHLPENIFVRAYESRMDLLRAVIVGPKGTPYQDGLFFFDVYFPCTYPLGPPLVRYHSYGLHINPCLFECGEARLNIYRSWRYPSCNANMLHILVFIQEQVLNAHPLLHQPGLLDSGPSVVAEYFSLLYNQDVMLKSFQTMAYIMNKPPKNFEAFVVGHFRDRVVEIIRATNACREGLQVGDDVGDRESFEIRDNVHFSMLRLYACFIYLGATAVSGFFPRSPIPEMQSGFGYFVERPTGSASAPATTLTSLQSLSL